MGTPHQKAHHETLACVRLLLILMLAGCSGASLGGPCSVAHACGDGAICDLTDPDGPTCIDAAGDVDGDGIPNGNDFCEHAPGGAHDEDTDGIGDDCDPCPIAKPPAGSTGFGATAAPQKTEDQVNQILDLYARCKKAVEG